MVLFQFEDLKLNWSVHMRRYSLSKNDQWVSLSPSSLKVFISLIGNNVNYNKVVITQTNSEIAIIQLMGNYLIQYSGKNICSSIIINESMSKKILENSDRILEYCNGNNSSIEEKSKTNNRESYKKRKSTHLIPNTSKCQNEGNLMEGKDEYKVIYLFLL